jgi:hypothetical protein
MPIRILFAAKPRAQGRKTALVAPGRFFVPYRHFAAAMLCGFALRLFFILRFPYYTGDTKFYEELARNWLDHGVYGLFVNGSLYPVDVRVPGYSAFLASVYVAFGRTRLAVMLLQATVDLATCVLAAFIAARIAPARARRRAAVWTLWATVLCPFTAIYTAVPVTETLATCFTTAGLAILLVAFAVALSPRLCSISGESAAAQRSFALRSENGTRAVKKQPVRVREALVRVWRRWVVANPEHRSILLQTKWWLLAGVVAGFGTLFRPETPLLLLTAGLVLCGCRWRTNWPKAALAGLWMGVGLIVTLTPWAARNAFTLGRIQFLAPRYAESYGDFVPRGFFTWTKTWMTRYQDAYTATWRIGNAPIEIASLPASAFDSPTERAYVAGLLEQYNTSLRMTPLIDGKFQKLAEERASRHPMRTWLAIPLERAVVMWLAPRVDVLRYSGELTPASEMWRANPAQFSVTLGFGILAAIYLAGAAVGAWRFRRDPGVQLIVVYAVIRTALLTQMQTIEPRYVLECFPGLIALGAIACAAVRLPAWTKESQAGRTRHRVPAVAATGAAREETSYPLSRQSRSSDRPSP